MTQSDLRIIAFTHAGGNKFSFQMFSKRFNDFSTIEYRRRELRIKESSSLDIKELLDDLLKHVKKEINSCDDYIIYGHSMGALMGYLICQKIEELALQKPLKLVVSGKKAPFVEREKISHLPDKIFWEEIIKLGGVPDELQDYPELVDYYTPILKADFRIVENYKYIKKEKLTIPIDVFYGSEEATKEEMNGWKDETTSEVTITQMEGNHFFIFKHVDFFINYFKNIEETIKL
jgi:surfactin synthase thioesterase subunit